MPADLWDTVQGGALPLGSKYVVTIQSAHFAPQEVRNPRPGQAATQVAIVFEGTSEPELPSWALNLTVGNGWTIANGGQKVEWVAGQGGEPGFNSSSRYGEWIDHAKKAAPEWVAACRASKRTPDQAAVWVGTSWLCEVLDTGRPRDDGKGNIAHLLPVKLLSQSAAPAAAPAPSTGPDATEEVLRQLAKSMADHTSFFQAVMANDALKGWVMAKGRLQEFLSPREDGFYHKARAGAAA
jgi:hypothetical protein